MKSTPTGLVVMVAFLFGTVLGVMLDRSTNPKELSPTANAATEPTAPKVITVGNNSYVPINLNHADPRAVLDALDLFDKFHPALRVTHWHVRETANHGYIAGLWLTHEPR